MTALIVGVVGLVVLAVVIRVCAQAAARIIHSPAGRWFTGHHLDGMPRTDAGWFRRGVKVMHPSGHASRWAHKPRAERAAWRTGGTLGALAVLYGLAVAPAATTFGLADFGAGIGGWGTYSTWRGLRSWRHTRQWVRPLHVALSRPLGLPGTTRPRDWLEVPEGYHRTEGAEVTITLPEHFSGGADAKRGITEIVAAKLALEDPKASWHLAGKKPFVSYTVQVPPPDKVTLDQVRQIIAEARETAPLVGLGRAGKPVHADLDSDSPHLCLSMGSGGGKSVCTRCLTAQVLNKGGVALILDIKRLSHAWARGLPNVRYCRSVEEIHNALIWLADEVERRNVLADEGADEDGNTDHVDVGPRLVVLAEEMNATANRLRSYWRQVKDKDDPAESPALEALGDALFMGRQIKVNVFGVAQMFTARTAGGPEARENMGVRILARYTLNNWRMMVPEIWPAPKRSRHRGRMQVCISGKAYETQGVFMTPAEARELATSGVVATFPAEGRPSSPAAVPLHVASKPVGLAQAVSDGIVPIGLEAVRKARQRDPEFPQPRAAGPGGEHLYDPAELEAWARNRPRAGAAVGA